MLQLKTWINSCLFLLNARVCKFSSESRCLLLRLLVPSISLVNLHCICSINLINFFFQWDRTTEVYSKIGLTVVYLYGNRSDCRSLMEKTSLNQSQLSIDFSYNLDYMLPKIKLAINYYIQISHSLVVSSTALPHLPQIYSLLVLFLPRCSTDHLSLLNANSILHTKYPRIFEDRFVMPVCLNVLGTWDYSL